MRDILFNKSCVTKYSNNKQINIPNNYPDCTSDL